MLKGIGIVLIVAVCSAFGFYKANLLRVRQRRLSAICLFIGEAADRIRIGEEMSRIIDSIGESAGFYKDGYKIFISPDGLSDEDRYLANEFAHGLGMGDTVSQLKRCETYSALFKKAFNAAEAQAKEKASVYGKLGVFAGLLIGVVML